MTNVLRWIVVAVVAGHGFVHLLGVAKGFGWADVSQLKQPIAVESGIVWLLSALLVLASAALIGAGAPTWWWAIAACGAILSQVAIATSWSDAKAGTLVNVLLILVAAYGFLSVGPTSFHAQWEEQATHALSGVDPAPPVLTDTDLDELPGPLAAYIHRSQAVGKPRTTSLYADFHGRIRSGPDAAWMSFTGRQLNTFGTHPQRLFIMDATKSGLPVTMFHS